MRHFVLVDLAGIQGYVFRSNKLSEATGASHLAGGWFAEQVKECAKAGTIAYASGGGALIEFDTEALARAFCKELSMALLKGAPGLRARYIIQENCKGWWTELGEKLEQTKQRGVIDAPFGGLGVIRSCTSTKDPAAGRNPKDDSRWASPETIAKADKSDGAHEQLTNAYKLPNSLTFPKEFDDLGGTRGDKSTLAVVHADGNGFGARFLKAVADCHADPDKIGELSKAIDAASQAAMQAVIDRIGPRINGGVLRHPEEKAGVPANQLELPGFALDKNVADQILPLVVPSHFFPLRPLLLAGDDVTFVCDGRIGLAAALAYLEEFKAQMARVAIEFPAFAGATASAGVAIVKAKYPFSDAYRLAEQLCANAKGRLTDSTTEGLSAIDWHITTQNVSHSLSEMREADYQIRHGSLTQHPCLVGAGDVVHSWDIVNNGISAFQGDGWQGRRSKAKALRDALVGGTTSVNRFRTKYLKSAELPKVSETQATSASDGWQGDFCFYWDALELADIFIPLPAVKEEPVESHD